MTATISTLPGVRSELMTPERAKELLDNNTNNRSINQEHVKFLANAMKTGRFKFNGDTVRISDTNRFLDGQHRLLAVVMSGVSIPMLVVYGIPDDAQDTIDQGLNKSVAHILQQRGIHVPNVSNVRAVASILCAATQGLEITLRDRGLMADFVADNREEIGGWVAYAATVTRVSPLIVNKGYASKPHRSIATSPLAALCIHMSRGGADVETMVGFFDGVAQGFNLDTTILQSLTPNRLSVLQAMNKRLSNGIPLTRTGGGFNVATLLAEYPVYVNAYNKFVRDERMTIAKSTKNAPRYLADLPKVETAKAH